MSFGPRSVFRVLSIVFSLLTFLLIGVAANAQTYSIWSSSAVPSLLTDSDNGAVELGVKFKSDVAGKITGIRFYKGPYNTGTHTATLWTSTGTKLATATFASETASGWQQVNFSTPVSIAANTVYVASYHTNVGHYSVSEGYFAVSGDNPPLHALSNSAAGGNGVYVYGSGGAFPNQTYQSSNYWVDVVFTPSTATSSYTVSGAIAGGSGATATLSGATAATVTADASGNYTFTGLPNGTYAVTPSKAGYTMSPASASVTVNGANVSGVNFTATAVPVTTYSISGTLSGGAGATVTLSGAKAATATADTSGNFSFAGLANGTYTVTPSKAGLAFTPANQTVSVSGANLVSVNFTASATTGTTCPCSIWSASTTPAAIANDPYAVELGVKFTSDTAGFISGIRFYKGSTNTGTHTGTLWSNAGTVLATATFTNETASGWQQVNFSQPVAIAAGTTYVASYHTNAGNYAVNQGMFANGVDSGSLHALSNTAASGNGVYVYGATAFPNKTYQSTNYWVDVVFTTTGGTSTNPPPATYAISGTISGGAGSTVALSGAMSASVTADASGNFTFTGLANGSYTVTPSLAGYTFTPTNKAVSVSGTNVTGVNFTAAATAPPPSSHSVTLNWGASTSSTVSGYYVYRSTTSGGGYTKLNSAPNTSTTFSDLGVAAGTTYYYVVTAVNSSGQESAYSNEATVAVPTP